VIHTVDGGRSWRRQTLADGPGVGVLTAVTFAADDGIAVGRDEETLAPLVFTTADGGEHWTSTAVPSPFTGLDDVIMVP